MADLPRPAHSEDDPAWVPPRRGSLTADAARLRASNRLLVALLVRLFEVLRNRDSRSRKKEIDALRGKFEKARQRIRDRGDD